MQSLLHAVMGPSGPYTADLNGKVAVVTGGSTGIGFECSRWFARMGAHVIMTNNDPSSKDEALEKISAECQKEGSKGKAEWVQCDQGSLKEVKEVFTGIRDRLDRLDILILSAGLNSNQFGLDADGIERIMGINAFSHYFIMNIFYSLMRKTSTLPDTKKGSVRIVFESSELHRAAPGSQDSKSRARGCHFGSEEEITEGAKDLAPYELYGRTKLAMILYGKALRDKVIRKNGDDIYILSVHPGVVNTDLQNQWEEAYPSIVGTIMKGLSIAASRDPEQGCYSGLYAALSPEVVEKNYNGFYLTDPAQPGKESAQGEDLNLATALWELSERVVKRIVGDDALQSWSK